MVCDRMRGDFPCLKQQLNADGTCIKCNCLLDEHPEGHCQTNEPVVQDVSTSMRSLKRGTELKFCCCVISFSPLSTFREWSFRVSSVARSIHLSIQICMVLISKKFSQPERIEQGKYLVNLLRNNKQPFTLVLVLVVSMIQEIFYVCVGPVTSISMTRILQFNRVHKSFSFHRESFRNLLLMWMTSQIIKNLTRGISVWSLSMLLLFQGINY
jgi:hypothetical protein